MSGDLSFLNNMEIFLKWTLMSFTGVLGKNGFTLDYLLKLAVVICVYASMGKKKNLVFAMCTLSWGLCTDLTHLNFTQVTFLEPED